MHEPGGSSRRWQAQHTWPSRLNHFPITDILECFCLLDLGQACQSLIITQMLFSERCVFCFDSEGLVNRSGGVRAQVNRGRVFHSAWRGIFLACHHHSLNGQLGPLRAFLAEKRRDDRVKTPQPCWKSSIFHCFKIPDPQPAYLSLYSGIFQTASSPPDSHKTTLQSSAAVWCAFLLLLEETQLDTT